MIEKAASLGKIYQAFRGEPLKIDELAQYYQNLEKGRGGTSPRRRMARILGDTTNVHERILFTGYKGCGKSTELNHLQQDISTDFLVINFSVMEELDPVHLNYIELFIVIMEKLFSKAEEHELAISEEYLKNIQYWLSSKEIQEIKEKYNIGAEAEAGAEGSMGIPFLQKFFFKFKMTAKSSRSLKETIKTNIEPKLSELISLCNLLITEIKLALPYINRKDLVVIIEDLDKIPIERAKDLFFNYAAQITQLRTNTVFTFPISLYNSIRFNTIKAYFTNPYELPMIKVANKDETDNPEGMDALRSIVAARMDMGLFEQPTILTTMIRDCGGCIRDLFRLIQEAAENALDYIREKITEADRLRAWQTLKKEYEGNIADNMVGNTKYPVAGYFDLLVKLAKSKNKKPENTEELLHLRDNLCVLGYNGDGWCDVHPIVKAILKERNKWDGQQTGD